MATIRYVDTVVIERVLEMGGGYVLRDFSNPKFSAFFAEHGVDLNDEQYKKNGDSKANRLRTLLKLAPPKLAADVLDGLLELRQLQGGLEAPDLELYQKAVAKLRGDAPAADATPAVSAEDELMKRAFDPAQFAKLPVDGPVARLLVERMEEAHSDIGAKSFLSAIIMCGSVLEGMCLGYGNTHMKEVNQAYAARYNQARRGFAIGSWRSGSKCSKTSVCSR